MRLFAHGFARAWCDDCGHDYFVAFSCKGRGVCPSCNTRRMVETAAHLTDHVFPRLPVRQWMLSVPKRLRYFMQRDGAVLNMVLRIFLRVIAQSLSAHCPGAVLVVCNSSRPGIWRRNRHPTLGSISASVGEWEKKRFGLAAG